MQPPCTEHVFIYEKYFAYYEGDGTILREMIGNARQMGETACTLYEEYASECDPSVTGDDLERIFERGLDGRPSIRSLVEKQAIAYRHILRFRTAMVLDCFPCVSVRYMLVWKK